MSERIVYVHIDLDGEAHFVGRLWEHNRKGKTSSSFEYDETWLSFGQRFALEPALTLTKGQFHTGGDKAAFGAFGDSAPDRWGRVLMRRAARRQAEAESQTPPTLLEMDYLLGVNDEARQGALRFADTPDGPFLADRTASSVPPLVELPRLLSAAERLAEDEDTEEDLLLLLAPGSSLGGARPKASVREADGGLAIAKFPHKNDEFPTNKWEAVALTLAAGAGIPTPDWRLENIAGKDVTILRRFDRDGDKRIPFLSAMSMIGAKDNEEHSYLEIADALRQYGAAPKNDRAALWRRIVFNILISNTDDHLRNHAFLYTGDAGWRLSPAYDLNPVPVDIKPRVLSTQIDLDDGTCSLELARSVAGEFGLNKKDAQAIIAEVGRAVIRWRETAQNLGLKAGQIDRMASAFEHNDLEDAVRHS